MHAKVKESSVMTGSFNDMESNENQRNMTASSIGTEDFPSEGFKSEESIRHLIDFTHNNDFDVNTLEPDLRRVYGNLSKTYDEEYALVVVFIIRTAIELHRAWHVTLLTDRILQRVKERFNISMIWNLGVFRLAFRMEDGMHEIHRRIPYDYDSEYQDKYFRTASALVEGHINVHEALKYQNETIEGKHTAPSGMFLRNNPGRLVLYPLQAATCAVIFFSGDWTDGGVAAICGLTAGILQHGIGLLGGEAEILTDLIVGFSTGMIGALFYQLNGLTICLSSVFLGTLYWFFFGTAFVLGLLEIIAGQLETGVTRFVGVSIKTFVLCLGAAFGMLLVMSGWNSTKEWQSQNENCQTDFVEGKWWRIPLYLLCSASALGQYRFPVDLYWLGLSVQLVGYEIQYEILQALSKDRDSVNIDIAAANLCAAAGSVIAACIMCNIVDWYRHIFYARLLHRDIGRDNAFDNLVFNIYRFLVRLSGCLKINRKSDVMKLKLEKKLKQQREEVGNSHHSRKEMVLDAQEKEILIEGIVGAEKINVWAVLMPAVYQLVPGSMIANLWFGSIFQDPENSSSENDVFSTLMVTAVSLALGLALGSGIFQILESVYMFLSPFYTCNSIAKKYNRTSVLAMSTITGKELVSEGNNNFSTARSDH